MKRIGIIFIYCVACIALIIIFILSVNNIYVVMQYFNTASLLEKPLADLQRLKDIADFRWTILSTVSLLFGGIFAFIKLAFKGDTKWMPNLSLDTQILPYRNKLRLLVIYIRSTNPSANNLGRYDATFYLDIHSIPSDRNANQLIGYDDKRKLINGSIDLLEGRNSDYEMFPNAQRDNMRTLVLSVGTIVWVTARLKIFQCRSKIYYLVRLVIIKLVKSKIIKRKIWKVGWRRRKYDFVSASSVLRIEP